jgi:type I restriction enzyme S subunit
MGEYTLSEIASVVDCEHKTAPKVEHSEYYSIRTTNIKNGKIDFKNANRVSVETYLQWIKREIPEPGDIILAREAPVGEVGWIKEGFKVCLGQRTVLLKATHDDVSKRYLLYYLTNPATKYDLQVRSAGSVVSHLNMKDIRSFKVLLPSLPEQKAIASVLSSLDNKIDLLHRQNKILEAMAETLFRQWFVEEAQEDWEKRPLSSIADFLNGLACQKFPPKNELEKLPVLKIRELRNGIPEDSDWATTDVKPDYIVENGDIIFSWSASLIVKIWDDKRCILNQHLFKVTSVTFPKWFYYQWCKYHLAEFIAISTSHATTMGHIKRGDLDVAMVLVPTEEELVEMTAIMSPIISKIIENNKQIRTIEKLRDTLLRGQH